MDKLKELDELYFKFRATPDEIGCIELLTRLTELYSYLKPNVRNRTKLSELEQIAQLYPTSLGRSPGVKKLKKLSKEDYPDLRQAVINFRNYCITKELEDRYIMHFNTFAGRWEDWIEAPVVINSRQEKRKLQRKRRPVIVEEKISKEQKEINLKRISELNDSISKGMKV